MTRRLRVDAAAGDELEAAAAWYEVRRVGLGRDLLASVDATLTQIVESPAAGSRVPGVAKSLGVRRRLVPRFPYAIVYLELAEEVRIVAFAHGSRRPGYWKAR